MTARAGLAYGLARLQARLGRRPDKGQWRTLEAARTAAHALELARRGPWAAWLDGVGDPSDAAQLERRLRRRWDAEVEAVAGWLPPGWRAVVRLQGRLAPWPLPDDAPEPLARWSAAWAEALPQSADRRLPWRAPAEWLCPRLVGRNAGRAGRPAAAEQALRRLFRRHAGQALPAFAYLALAALDLERLRGVLVARAMFEAEGRAEA